MSTDPAVDALVKAINHNAQWIGQTTRELRDKVESQAKETEMLRASLGASIADAIKSLDSNVSLLSRDIGALTSSIKTSSDSSALLSKRMYVLTILLAVAAIAQAVAAYLHVK